MSINLTIRFLGNLYDDLLFISCQLAKVILDIRAYEKVTLPSDIGEEGRGNWDLDGEVIC